MGSTDFCLTRSQDLSRVNIGRAFDFSGTELHAGSSNWSKAIFFPFADTANKRMSTIHLISMEESADLPVQAWKAQEQPVIPFAELKIPKACDYVGKKTPGQFTCARCGRSYMRKDSLQRHMHWECGKEPQFKCPFCPQRCKRKAHWLRHIRRQHREHIDSLEKYLHSYTPKVEVDWVLSSDWLDAGMKSGLRWRKIM